MGGKAKPTKHTAKELAMKDHLANCNRGGGKEGMADRQPVKNTYECKVCLTPIPDRKTLVIHLDNKHPKYVYDLDIDYPEVIKEVVQNNTHVVKKKKKE